MEMTNNRLTITRTKRNHNGKRETRQSTFVCLSSNKRNKSIMKVPSILSFVPYSTLTILLVVVAFKYQLALEIWEVNATYWNLSKERFLIYFVVTVVGLMFLVQLIWFIVAHAVNFFNQYREGLRLDKKEREALIAVFNAMNGSTWNKKDNWLSNEHVSNWKGVKINPTTKRVNKLILADNNCTGFIPPEIADLHYLIELDLRRNEIRGPIPESVSTMEHLEGLYLHDNYLTGKIPDGISNLPALSGIYLFNNCFDDREASVQTFNENMHENSYIFI